MHSSLRVAVAVALLASSAVHAQNRGTIRYSWHDAQGLPHFSDSLNAEAMKYGYDLVNEHGLVIQHVSRQLTPEERAVASKLAAKKAAIDRAALDVANTEAQMLSAYPTEEMYSISLQQTLSTIDQQIHTTQINLRSQEKALTDLLGRAADLESAKHPVPKFLVDGIAKQRAVVTDQRNRLHRQQALRAETVAFQVKQLARYRELKAEQGKSSR